MTKYTVIDAMPGAGKTSWLIEQLNDPANDKKYIYITPYLDEITRLRESVTERELKEPNRNNNEGRKLRSLKMLVEDGEDIASTHSLLQTADYELIQLLRQHRYTLVVDEAMTVIEDVNIDKYDIERLVSNKDIEINDTDGKVTWNGTETKRFKDIQMLAKAGTLYYSRNSMMVKIFSDEVLKTFTEVIAMTYLFEYSYMSVWYELNGVSFDMKSIKYNSELNQYELIEYDKYAENRQALYKLINIYEGKYNEDLSKLNLSSSGYRRILDEGRTGVKKLDLISRTTRNFLDKFKEDGAPVFWTTFKEYKEKKYLAPRGYSNSFISLNTRATNIYADSQCIAYLISRHPRPMQTGYFTDKGLTFNNSGWSLSDLLQLIYRSRVRKGEPIQLFLPSKDMRDLLDMWASYEL